LGVKPHYKDDADGLFSIYRADSKSKTTMISAYSQLNHWGLVPAKSLRYEPVWSDRYDMLIIDLDKPLGKSSDPASTSDDS